MEVIWKFGDDTTSTMVMMSIPGGIGAIGSDAMNPLQLLILVIVLNEHHREM